MAKITFNPTSPSDQMYHPVEECDDGVGAGAGEEAGVLPCEGDGLGDAALLVQGQRLRHTVVSEKAVGQFDI